MGLMYLSGNEAVGMIASWLFLPFLLRFTRLMSPRRGFVAMFVAQTIVISLMLRGELPLGGLEYTVTVLSIGLFGGLILLVDRLVSPRLGNGAATLVLPAAGVTASFVTYGANPFGTWGETAYTQLGFSPFLQLAAVTGVWGMAFLMSWFASVTNAVREQGWKARGVVTAWGLTFAIVLVYGGVRLSRPVDGDRSLPVAAITWDRSVPRPFATCPRDDVSCFNRTADAVQDVLFERSARAVGAGARLILWSEAAAEILAPGEADLILRGREFAREHDITLVMAIAVIPLEPGLWENKLIAVTSDGEVAWEYRKARPVPGEPIVAGDGMVPFLDTPFGRVAAVICFDADFPELIRQAGRGGADLLLVAANDWEEVADTHARMAVFRAVENGVSLLRSTSGGWSVAADGRGGILARSNHFMEDVDYLLATVPMRGEDTAYSRLGDTVGWFSTGFLILASLVASIRSRRSGKELSASDAR